MVLAISEAGNMGKRDSGTPDGQFRTTRWGVVLGARQSSAPGFQEAFESLCETYWHPLFFFVRVVRGCEVPMSFISLLLSFALFAAARFR